MGVWVVFLGALRVSQLRAACVHGTFHSIAPVDALLLGGRYFQLPSTEQEMQAPGSEVALPVKGKAGRRAPDSHAHTCLHLFPGEL